MLWHAGRSLRVGVGCLGLPRLDAIAQPAPRLAAVRSRGDVGSKRGGSQQCQERLFTSESLRIPFGARFE
jgi:hypothetical protein